MVKMTAMMVAAVVAFGLVGCSGTSDAQMYSCEGCKKVSAECKSCCGKEMKAASNGCCKSCEASTNASCCGKKTKPAGDCNFTCISCNKCSAKQDKCCGKDMTACYNCDKCGGCSTTPKNCCGSKMK